MRNPHTLSLSARWNEAWQIRPFRLRMIAGTILLFATLAIFPIFFQYIEKRNGVTLNDIVLDYLPPHNMSIAIFLIMWTMTAYTFARSIRDPFNFIVFLWAYVIVSISRLLSISLVALNPPVNLVELKDPLSNTFYGMKIVTKDLFYSGHTSSIFLMFLVLKKPLEKVLTLMATLLVATMLLIQHVHYTIDIIAAPFFTWIFYLLAKSFCRSMVNSSQLIEDR